MERRQRGPQKYRGSRSKSRGYKVVVAFVSKALNEVDEIKRIELDHNGENERTRRRL